MKRLIIWCLLFALIGAVTAYAITPTDPIIYHDVIVPAARIVEREVPGEVRWRDRIVYKYVQADVRATAPGGATLQVSTFCAPTVAVIQGDTTPQPRTEMIRSVVHESSWFPIRRGSLLVTSAASNGDLLSRDYRVRDDFGVGSGDSVVVRYGRLNVGKELVRGFAWYVAFRGLEAVVRAILDGNASQPWYQEGL